jgi:glycogen debranching enzyme
VREASSGCFWLPPIASVALNSFLYRDAAELEALAPAAERAGDVKKWRDRKERLWTAFEKYCFVPDEKRYWDYNQRTHIHHKCETFYMFLPIWAGMPVPDDAKRDLIENVLLNPAKFYGDIPFPSVAYDHPAYEPDGYWRGKAWPHFSYFMLEVLAHNGYEREADVAADRILSHLTHVRGFLENMTTDPTDTEPSGFNDYNWGSASFCLVAERRYRKTQ